MNFLNFQLTYFTARGLAECSRLTLHYAGQDFEDVRLEYKQFLELKESEYSVLYL